MDRGDDAGRVRVAGGVVEERYLGGSYIGTCNEGRPCGLVFCSTHTANRHRAQPTAASTEKEKCEWFLAGWLERSASFLF